MAAISAPRSANVDPPRSLAGWAAQAVPRCRRGREFLPRRPNTSCHPNRCLCRIGHLNGSSVFALALNARAVRSAERLLSGRSGSGPSYECLKIPSGRLCNQCPLSLALRGFTGREQVGSHPCSRAFPDLPVCPHRTGRFSASASNPGAIPERGVSERASIWFRSPVRASSRNCLD
jgi:hypothetical protein